MIKIDFLKYQNKLKTHRKDGKRFLYGTIRHKYLVLQPEELVRQLVIEYFVENRKFNKNHIAVEKLLIVNERRKRCDILVYKNGRVHACQTRDAGRVREPEFTD